MLYGNIFLIERRRIAHFLYRYYNPTNDNICIVSSKFKIFIFLIILLTVSASASIAQNQIAKSATKNKNEDLLKAESIYNETFHNHSKILTGKYYNDSYRGIKDHPYYNESSWKIGSVGYENQEYDSIEIKYDVYRDLLLVKYIDEQGYIRPIQLYSAKVEAFQLYGHHFQHLEGDSLPNDISGFFDLLHSGNNASVLAKRRKEIDQSNTLTSLEHRFVTKDKLYIRLGQNFYEIKKRKSMLEVLSDRKSELKAYLKLNKSRFKNDHEKELVEAVKYYNSIVNINGS